MKTIIAGGRDYKLTDEGRRMLDILRPTITEVVSGKARGADSEGERWANENGIPVKGFPADWGAHGKAAGPIRNQQMADYAEQLIAFWDGKSSGTRDMIRRAVAKRITVHVIFYGDH
ncbi:MAG: hypothetical protein CMK32_10245 [Porticoccaceae bacterium]|nr:hypothetical protein [Porticoccaceae bacterium]